jgi:hypothetical protein
VSLLSLLPRLSAVVTGLQWKSVHKLLGTPGLWQRLRGKDVPKAPVDEARVLVTRGTAGSRSATPT